VWKWRELKRGEEEINEIIGRAGGQSSEVGPYTGAKRPHTHTQSQASTHTCSPFRIHSEALVCICVCVCVCVYGGDVRARLQCVWGCWVVLRRCKGYGDKLRCPVTSIWGGLGLVCRVPLKVICCRISDGLEMGLEREFMPPITEKREGYPECTQRTEQLTRTLNARQACTAASKNGKKRRERKRGKKPVQISAISCVHVRGLPDCAP